jgi:hypothetical protein
MEGTMARRLLGVAALLIAVTSLSPAHSATLMNNTLRISPALQFHSVSPGAQFSERHSLSDIHVTKHLDKTSSKLMMRTPPPPPTTPLPIPYPNSGAQQ